MTIQNGDKRIEVRYAGTGSPAAGGLSVWHVRDDQTLAGTDFCVDAIRDFYTALVAFYPTGWTATVGSRVIDLFQVPNVLVPATPLTVTGTGGSTETLPLQTALTCRLRGTGLVRRQQGRIFLPAMIESQNISGGVPAPATVTAINTALSALVAQLAGRAATLLCVFSRADNTLYEVISAQVAAGWSVLRSRRG